MSSAKNLGASSNMEVTAYDAVAYNEERCATVPSGVTLTPEERRRLVEAPLPRITIIGSNYCGATGGYMERSLGVSLGWGEGRRAMKA